MAPVNKIPVLIPCIYNSSISICLSNRPKASPQHSTATSFFKSPFFKEEGEGGGGLHFLKPWGQIQRQITYSEARLLEKPIDQMDIHICIKISPSLGSGDQIKFPATMLLVEYPPWLRGCSPDKWVCGASLPRNDPIFYPLSAALSPFRFF